MFCGLHFKVPASDSHPDCCFVEDTAMFFKSTKGEYRKFVVLSRAGAPSRQGEVDGVRATLQYLSETRPSLSLLELENGTIDGGDVLFTGDCVLVGNSSRSNAEGIASLRSIIEPLGLPFHAIPVSQGLHLKSCCSLIDDSVLVISDDEAGRKVRAGIEATGLTFEYLTVPQAPPSNVLRIGNAIIIQDGFPESEEILVSFASLRNLSVYKLNMSEFIKVDGALTCCSVLLDL